MPSLQRLLKLTGSNITRILKGQDATAATLQTLLAKFLVLAINLATGVITARLLGPTGRGEQTAMILWPIFLANAMTLGLPAALTYNLKAFPQQRAGLCSAAMLLGTGLGTLAVAIGVVGIPYWLSQYSTEVIQFAQWMMLVAPLCLLLMIGLAGLEAIGAFTLSNQAQSMLPLLTLMLLGGFATTGALNPYTSTLSYGLVYLPIAGWTLWQLWQFLPFQSQKILPLSQRLIHYGLRSYGIDLLKTLSAQVDQVVIVGLLPPAAMGMYVVALSISRMLNVFYGSTIVVLFPKLAAQPPDEVLQWTGRITRISTLVTLVAGIALMILSPVLLQLLYGSEFTAAVPVLRILLVESGVSGMTLILSQAFMALGRPGIVAVLQSIGFGLSIPLMLGLVPVFGLMGAGLALLGATSVRFLAILVCFPLVLRLAPPSLLIQSSDWQFLKQRIQQSSES